MGVLQMAQWWNSTTDLPVVSKCFRRDSSKHPCQRPPCYFAWGCFRYFSWEREPRRPCGCLSRDDLKGGLPGRSSRAARPAFARWALAWQPSLRNGLPSRTDCELAVGAVCCEPLSRGIRLLLNEKFKIERRNEGRGNFFPSFPGFNRVGK